MELRRRGQPLPSPLIGVWDLDLSSASRHADAGEFAEAMDIFKKVREFAPPQFEGPAAFGLGNVLCAMGDLDGAIEALQAAFDSYHPTCAIVAGVRLGLLLVKSQSLERALRVLRPIAELRNAEHSGYAELALAELFASEGDMMAAREAYQRAQGLGPEEAARLARQALREIESSGEGG